MAREYGMVRVFVDDAPMGEPIDLYNLPDVIATGQLSLGSKSLEAGTHRLTLEMVAANAVAAGGDKVGVDYLRVTRE